MKKLCLAALSTILVIAMAFNAFAIPFNPNDYTSVNEYSELLPKGVTRNKASERAVRRGDFLVGADLVIINKGNGDIGAYGKGLIEVPVQEAYITIYLDCWDETEASWIQVAYYDAEFYAEDYPDGLVTPTVDIVFKNQPRGHYYRLRGAFAAYDGTTVEGFSPSTAGVFIE
ncbi:MAG: DUF6147 family protein [Clostridium sp.]|nr:DUF6147 family protein [Clostridium sp.]